MKTTLGLLLFTAAAALSVNVATARDVTEKNSTRQTLRFAGSGGKTLEVRAINGSITVQPHEGGVADEVQQGLDVLHGPNLTSPPHP